MKILILGGDGMLGHKLVEYFSSSNEVFCTFRKSADQINYNLSRNVTPIHIDIETSGERILTIIDNVKPDVVINCIGIIKQRDAAENYRSSIFINALFPHMLAGICKQFDARLITFSTDCVFDGSRGNYKTTDISDAKDLYGRTKFLGEVPNYDNVLTIRTSIIGLELHNKKSLVEWFLAQRGEIQGFSNAIFTGVTTREMARVINHVLHIRPDLCGVHQLASEAIDKYTLLSVLAKKLDRTDVTITNNTEFHCDRSLINDMPVEIASWDFMLEELANEIKARKVGGN